MHDWLSVVSNTEGISALFSKRPDLSRIDIHSLVLQRGGPSISLVFDVTAFPENPPAKWVASEANTMQISLLFIGVQDVQIRGHATRLVSTLVVDKEGPLHTALIENESIQWKFKFESAVVDKISAYSNA